MISMWVPEKEKSAFVSFAYVGGTFGSIITNPMCGAILATIGWEVSIEQQDEVFIGSDRLTLILML